MKSQMSFRGAPALSSRNACEPRCSSAGAAATAQVRPPRQMRAEHCFLPRGAAFGATCDHRLGRRVGRVPEGIEGDTGAGMRASRSGPSGVGAFRESLSGRECSTSSCVTPPWRVRSVVRVQPPAAHVHGVLCVSTRPCPFASYAIALAVPHLRSSPVLPHLLILATKAARSPLSTRGASAQRAS